MSFSIKLGLKNIGRNRLRSALTISAVALCSGGLVLYSVLFAGSLNMMLDALINQSGHARIVHKEIAKNERLSKGMYFVDQAEEIVKKLKKLPQVKSVVPRIDLGAFIDHNDKQSPAMGLGIDPIAEKDVLSIQKKIVSGKMIKSKGREIVLGYRLAKRLKAKVGSSVVLIGKTVDDSMSAIRTKVVGLFKTGTPIYDKMFYVNLPTAQFFLDIEGKASSILVFTDDLWKDAELLSALKKQQFPAKTIVQSWRSSPFAAYMIAMAKVMVSLLGGIVIFIGGIGLLNTMLMSVLERRKEVGILMALGLAPRKIMEVFLVEGLVFGVIGSVIGVLLASLASIPMITVGIKIGAEASEKIPMPITDTIKGVLTIEGILAGLIVGITATLVGSLWPAFKASRIDPSKAFHH